MSPRSGSRPAAPWRREAPGVYRSSDGRFEIDGDAPGRWFVRDTAERDELGLERTIGPFATLDAAKADAATRRGREPESSPLRARLGTGRRASVARATPARLASKESESRPRAPKLPPPKPPPPTWLERLEAERPEAAVRARRRIAALERLGIDDAEAVVRLDLEADEPAVAERLLARSLGRAVREAILPAALRRAAGDGEAGGGAVQDEPGLRRLAALLATRVLAAALEVVSARERPADADPDLPGWRLVERDPDDPQRDRRLRLHGTDVPLDEGPA